MSETENTANPAPSRTSRFLRTMQTVAFVIVILLGVANIIHFKYRGLDGFPETSFWLLLGSGAALALWHMPILFFRLQRRWQIGAYVSIIPFLILMGSVSNQSYAAFHRTPEGKAELARQEVSERREAEAESKRAESRRVLAEAEQTQADLEAYEKKIEGCFSTFGHRLPDLEEMVKSSLHNPGAFEHVESVAIVPDSERNNVAMTFRAENGFGAIRTAIVKAKVDADSCTVIGVGEPVIPD